MEIKKKHSPLSAGLIVLVLGCPFFNQAEASPLSRYKRQVKTQPVATPGHRVSLGKGDSADKMPFKGCGVTKVAGLGRLFNRAQIRFELSGEIRRTGDSDFKFTIFSVKPLGDNPERSEATHLIFSNNYLNFSPAGTPRYTALPRHFELTIDPSKPPKLLRNGVTKWVGSHEPSGIALNSTFENTLYVNGATKYTFAEPAHAFHYPGAAGKTQLMISPDGTLRMINVSRTVFGREVDFKTTLDLAL